MAMFSRSLPKTLILASFSSRSFFTSISTAISPSSHSYFSVLRRLRPLAAIVTADLRRFSPATTVRELATRATSSSLNDPNPNWSNRPPKETILLDGCDFEHWLVVMEKPEGEPTRDEIIDDYIKTLAMVVGSEEEARMKVYSVSTRCYFAFGALVSEELSYKIKELPKVRWVLPDSYLDVKNKNYGGEPFIDGQAVPYDPKYHDEWIRNNARANERNRRNDRPRNFDRSRNFERRRENLQNRDFQNSSMNQPMQNSGSNMAGAPPSNMSAAPPSNYGGMPPNNMGGGMSSNNFGGTPSQPPNSYGRAPPPPSSYGGAPSPPSNNYGGAPPPPSNNYGGAPPPSNNYGGAPPPLSNNYGGAPPPLSNNYGGAPPPLSNNYGGAPSPPSNNYGGGPPSNSYGGLPPPSNNYGGTPSPPSNNYGGAPPPPSNNYGRIPPHNFGGSSPNSYGGPPNVTVGGLPQQNNFGGMQSNAGWSHNLD